jgi:hypothetical protein
MNFKSIFKNLMIEEKKPIPEILANGSFADKKDIEDPTAKFCGPVHVGTVFKTRSRRSSISYNKSEYDLPMLANAVQLDGILRRAVNIFVEHVLKNGFEFTSKDDKVQLHITRRVKEIENLTGIAFAEILNQIVTQLVTYGNAYVIKVRKQEISAYGRPYRLFNRDNNPIVGLFVLDASTMEVGLNDQGYVTTYKQEIRGEAREWDERDIIHFTYNKIPGTLTGQSQIIPVLDDVRALRKLEEEIEILGFQYSIPLYLYKVGNKDIPPAPGEVDSVSATVNNMPAYGMLVVPGHHTIEVPTNANNVMDIIKYVEHFKQRIYSGLGVSPVAMGEADSSNRATSEVLDSAMQTITKSYQQIIKNKMQMEFIRELLLDGNFKDPDVEMEFNFPEIDLDNQIKKETHIVSLWQNNLITRTEARNMMDYEVNLDDQDTFLHLVDIPKIQAQADAQAMVAQVKAAATPKPAGVSSSKKNAKKTSNRVAPANQHGKNSVENLFDGLSIFNQDQFISDFMNDFEIQLHDALNYNIDRVIKFYHIDKPTIDNTLVDKYIYDLRLCINDKVKRAAKFLDDEVKLNFYSTKTREFLDEQYSKIESLSKILVCKSLGFKTILITSNDCENHSDKNFEISQMDYTKLPPFGYNCKCEISEENFHEFT